MILCVVYRQKMLVALQRAHVASILKYMASEGFSKSIMHSSFLSLSFFNMLLVIGGGFGTYFIPLPLCDPQVWFSCVLWFGFGSIIFVLPFPLHWVLRFMNFTKFSSLFPLFL